MRLSKNQDWKLCISAPNLLYCLNMDHTKIGVQRVLHFKWMFHTKRKQSENKTLTTVHDEYLPKQYVFLLELEENSCKTVRFLLLFLKSNCIVSSQLPLDLANKHIALKTIYCLHCILRCHKNYDTKLITQLNQLWSYNLILPQRLMRFSLFAHQGSMVRPSIVNMTGDLC